jgi:S1-C subfamily serine protease
VYWRAGVVVVTHHTLEREESITVTLPDGTMATADVAGRDPATDLAVLRLEGASTAGSATATAGEAGTSTVAVAQRGDSAALRAGQLVLALGRPWSHGVTAALGVVSAVAGEWRTWRGGRIDRLIRLDIAVHDGFSGGPLVDAAGRVLGINSSALARGGALTIPESTVERTVEQLLAHGSVLRGYLGVAMQGVRLPEALRQATGVPGDSGALVIHVEEGSPAARAGVLLGDVIVAIAGEPVSEPGDVAGLLGPERVGQDVPVRVIRGGRAHDISVAVAERPARRGR